MNYPEVLIGVLIVIFANLLWVSMWGWETYKWLYKTDIWNWVYSLGCPVICILLYVFL